MAKVCFDPSDISETAKAIWQSTFFRIVLVAILIIIIVKSIDGLNDKN
jgi:putative exporter of polyketide antibiotics